MISTPPTPPPPPPHIHNCWSVCVPDEEAWVQDSALLCSVPLAKIAPKQVKMLLVASEGWKWSLQLRFSDAALDLSWHFAIFRCAIRLVFLRVAFKPEDIPHFPLNLLTVWNTVLRQLFLHHYTSWHLTQTKSQCEKAAVFLVPSNCCGILHFLLKRLEVGL